MSLRQLLLHRAICLGFPKTLAIVVLCVCSAAPGTAQEPPPRAATDTLISPPLLENRSRAPNTVEVTITATRRQLSLVAGKSTDVFAYNGRIPGPTLEVRSDLRRGPRS